LVETKREPVSQNKMHRHQEMTLKTRTLQTVHQKVKEVLRVQKVQRTMQSLTEVMQNQLVLLQILTEAVQEIALQTNLADNAG